MDPDSFQESRKSARLPTQRSLEEDNILGMLAVMAGYVDQKSPQFMEAIATNRDQNILDRFVNRKLIKPYQAQAIRLSLEKFSFHDSEKFGEVFCKLYGNENKPLLDNAFQMQKNKKINNLYIGQILLELGHANMNQIIEVLKYQEKERTANNENLMGQIKFNEMALKPNLLVRFKQEQPEVFWIILFFTSSLLALLAYVYAL